MSTGTDGSGGWGKWYVAIGVGATVTAAAATGYLIWMSRKGKDGGPAPLSPQRANGDISRSDITGEETSGPPPLEQPDPPHPPSPTPLEQARAVKARGNGLFKEKKYREAIECYQEAIECCPDSETEDLAMFYHNIAACYESMIIDASTKDEKSDLWGKVLLMCDKAVALNKRYIKALVRRLRANKNLDKKRDALLDITRVIILDQNQANNFSVELQQLLKSISREMAEENYPKLGPLEPPSQLVRCSLMTYVWKDDLSRERLDGLWKGRDDVEGLDIENEPFISAASQYNNGQYSKLLEVLTQAIDEGHVVFRPHALLLRGSMYSLWRQDKCALDDLNAVLSLPDLPPEMYADVYVKLAAVLAGQSKLNESKQQFDKALNVRNDHVDVYIQRARVLMESDDPNEVLKARDDLEYALRLSPSTPHILYCYGSVYHRAALLTQSMQLLEDAKSKFEEAYQTHPSCVDGLILYSLFLQDIEEVDLSEKILKKGLQLEPDNASIHFSLSILYLLIHQDVGKAKSSLETAIAMDTSCVQAYEALASLKMQEGDYERAEELYQSAVDNSRSLLEMQQAFLSKEIFSTQNQVCREYNIDPVELMAKRIGMGQPQPQH